MKLKDLFDAIDFCQEFVVEILLPEQYWHAVGVAPKTAKVFPRNHNFITLTNITQGQREELGAMEVKLIRLDRFWQNGTEHCVMRLILDEKQQTECNCIAG